MIADANVGWPEVVLAVIAAVPGIIAAVASLLNHWQLKTPSGMSVGRQVEGALHTSLGNSYRLQALTPDGEATKLAAASAFEQKAGAVVPTAADPLPPPPAPNGP